MSQEPEDYRNRTEYEEWENYGSELSLDGEEPRYSDDELLDYFGERLENAVDDDRLLPDEISVAIMAMKIGLYHIEDPENAEKDILELKHDTLLETGRGEELREEILSYMKEEDPLPHDLRYLASIPAEELLDVYRDLEEL